MEPIEDNQLDSSNDDRMADNESDQNRQDIFEQTFHSLMNGFGEQCEKHNIHCAVALAKHPDFEDPFVFYRAPHIVDAATLMAQILRQIKSELYADLNTDKTN